MMKDIHEEADTAVDMLGPLGDVMMSSPELTAAGLSALVFTDRNSGKSAIQRWK